MDKVSAKKVSFIDNSLRIVGKGDVEYTFQPYRYDDMRNKGPHGDISRVSDGREFAEFRMELTLGTVSFVVWGSAGSNKDDVKSAKRLVAKMISDRNAVEEAKSQLEQVIKDSENNMNSKSATKEDIAHAKRNMPKYTNMLEQVNKILTKI